MNFIIWAMALTAVALIGAGIFQHFHSGSPYRTEHHWGDRNLKMIEAAFQTQLDDLAQITSSLGQSRASENAAVTSLTAALSQCEQDKADQTSALTSQVSALQSALANQSPPA